MKEILILTIAIVTIIIVLASYFYYKRSVMATIIELGFKIIKKKDTYANSKKYEKYIKKKIKNNNKKYLLPKFKYKCEIAEKTFDRKQIFVINNDNNNKSSECIILYLHGGAYVNMPSIFHFQFCDKLAKDLNAKIIFPIYPLAPLNNYAITYDFIEKTYKEILNKYPSSKIVIMGDSAGGGLALGFSMYVKSKGIKIPDKIIVYSPWLDVTMKNKDIVNYEEKDSMLSSYGLKKMGELWSKGTDVKNYKVSPIYGDVKLLDNVLMFVGTREIFYPDVKLMQDKLVENNVNSTLIIGENMDHDYPLYPIPEMKETYENIIKYINE